MAGPINIVLGATVGQFIANVRQAGQAAIQFAGTLNGTLAAGFAAADRQQRVFDRGLGRLGDNMKSFGRQASILTASIALIGTTSFSAYADINALQLGLQNITGSAEGATKRFNELLPVVRLPGLGLEEAVKGDVRLQAVGFSADQAKSALLQFGNALALTGGGKFELDSVLTQLTQMGGKAKVLSEDLKPILTSSPAVAKAVKDLFGTVDSEQITAKLEAAGRSPKDFIDDLILQLSKLERVQGGPKNAIENFGDSLKLAQFRLGESADQALGLTSKLNTLGDFLGRSAEGFAGLGTGAQVAIIGVTGLAAAIGPLALGIGTFISLVPTMTAGLKAIQAGFLFLGGPIGATIVAVAAVGGALATLGIAVQNYGQTLQTSADRNAIFAETQDKVTASISGETTKLNTLLGVARDETVSKNARLKAISDLNDLSPQYLGNLRLETINTAQATAAINQYTNALTLKAKVQTLYQQAADASIAADRAAAKSAKDYVDQSRFSLDRIAINVKTTASFSPEKDSERLFAELGQKRKDAEVKRALDAANIINKELAKAYADAAKSNIQLEPPKIAPFDYSSIDLAGSAFQKAKDRLKALKDEIASGKLKGIDVSAQQAEYDKLKASIDSSTDSFKKQTATALGTASALSTNERILKRLTLELKENPSNKALEERVALFGDLVTREKEAVQFKPVDIGDVKPINSNLVNNQRVNTIVSSGGVTTAGANGSLASLGLPGLAEFQRRTSEQLTNIRLETEDKKRQLASSIAGIPSVFGSIKDEMKSLVDSDPFNTRGVIDMVLASTLSINSAIAGAKDNLISGGADILAGLAEGIGSGQASFGNAIKSVIGLIADSVISIGRALIIASIPLIASGVGTPLGLKNAAAGAALLVAGGVVKGLAAAAFANGGIVSGPTLGLVGEYAGARNNPEVIAPLNKLKQLLPTGGGQLVQVQADFHLRKGDLVASAQDYNRANRYLS